MTQSSRASADAETPLRSCVTIHIARNQSLRGSLPPCIAVPAVTENCLRHLVHWNALGRPLTGEQVRHPHLGQRNPAGHSSASRYLAQASSSGNAR